MFTITCVHNTFLTKEPVSANETPNKHPVRVGKEYRVESMSEAKNGKRFVKLAYGQGDWWIFPAHWSGIQTRAISKQQAEHIFGNPITEAQLTDLNACLARFDITTSQRMRHFLSQIAHESGGLRWLKEIADGWAYEGREDLGNTQPGDGPRYKGAGAIQLTGRANYQAFSDYMQDPRIMEGCDYVAEKYPMTSAGFWWHNNRMNELCDRGATVRDVTLAVNGGLNGLQDRQYYYDRACRVV